MITPPTLHAANLLNFRHCDGLLVGDHRKRFERGHRQAQRRLQALDEFAHHVVMLRLGVKLLAAGDFANFDAALVGLVGRDQQIERRAHDGFFHAEGVRDLIERGGLVGGVDDGFERGFEFFGFMSFSLPNRR